MSGLLEEIRSINIVDTTKGESLTALASSQESPVHTGLATNSARVIPVTSDDVIQILRSHCDENAASQALRRIKNASPTDISLTVPGNRSGALLRVLVKRTIPDFFDTSHQVRHLIEELLCNYSGISSLLSELDIIGDATTSRTSRPISSALPYLQLLNGIICRDDLLSTIRSDLEGCQNSGQRRVLWRETCALLLSGKIVAVVAKFFDHAKKSSTQSLDHDNLAKGLWYSSRLAHWLAELLSDQETPTITIAEVLKSSLTFGYTQDLVRVLLSDCVKNGRYPGFDRLAASLSQLRSLDQRRFLVAMLRALNDTTETIGHDASDPAISAIIWAFSERNHTFAEELVAWIIDPPRCATSGLCVLRSCMAVINRSPEATRTVLERTARNFGDVMLIRHAPIRQQETCAQVILLAASYLYNMNRAALQEFARSGTHMNCISNRLDATNDRARLLGMCVATGISSLVDEPGKGLKFDHDELRSIWAARLIALTKARDEVGNLDDAIALVQTQEFTKESTSKSVPEATEVSRARLNPNAVKTPVSNVRASQPAGRIVELLEQHDEDDLIPYAKPDSDPEDEDDDPTLVSREKFKPPVYIRDLLVQLRNTESYETQKLAIEHAAPLLRRKAQFGDEIRDHAEELGLVLIGIQDTFELEGFVERRLQALIALLMSDPKSLGPWFCRQAFTGDYSLAQRAAILSAIGLTSRELAGHSDSDALNPAHQGSDHPSKRLPDRYHVLYSGTKNSHAALPSDPLHTITQGLTTEIMEPIAASTIDAAAGPTALKVRNKSSRLSRPQSERTRRIPNALAGLLQEAFFTPLLGHFQTIAAADYSSGRIYLQPFFLTLFLKTLGILLHASGSATIDLPRLTTEMWALLLSLRPHATEKSGSVLEALLFGLLTVLEVNQDDTRRMASEHGRELVETREWTGTILERLAGGDEQSDRVRGLAAGILIRSAEVIEKYQRLLAGELVDY